MKRIAPILAAALAALLLAGPATAFSLPRPKKPVEEQPAPPRPVVTEIVDGRLISARAIPGVIAAEVEVVLGFQTLGRVIERNFDVGDVVRKGDVLAAIDPDDLQGNVVAAEAAVEASSVRLQTAAANAERTRELARRNVASTAQLEQDENALAAAAAAYSQAQSELIRARDAEGFATMTAPFDGIISAVFVNAGAVVSAGQPVMQLSARNELEAVIDLPESALADVRPGDGFQVWSSDIAPPEFIAASVRLTEPLADAATRTRRVHLSLADKGNFRLGTLILARPASDGAQTITVPVTALRMQDDQPHVWLVGTENGQRAVTLRPVTTAGPVLSGRIAVPEGLALGDEIVTRGVNSLTPGQAVGASVTP
ncbi:efflux RND transporter periplasmic adaptor subunit [Paracoccus sp. DMF-8]|uniref:efflux RND transporter periplasmic adaptor subunit n=1 Tax=Paracoccus sp. DMF-8 TaxID=3019445 RepID=UPI0023E4553E|nr:efflux RND transporter periplasmic adaptor subunit [Paracoccus sp. DMF-8]MDF3607867.1 efflux RND transporter periplasmic adaptor subunit [Paracoccus sp. DMF-8]